MNKVDKFTKAPTVSQMNKKVNELCDFTGDVVSHVNNTSNPHKVTKAQVGLGNVENKSSATIRGELTKANVTDALGYTPQEPLTIDDAMSSTSTNPVQNKAIQTALDGKANASHTHSYLPLTGGTLTGDLVAPRERIGNTWYSVVFGRTTATPVETILYTGIKWKSGAHMPVLHIYGYAYGLTSPVEFKIGFYIYSDKIGWCGATNMGAWHPTIFLFKYTKDGVSYVAVGLSGSCYFIQLCADVEDEMGKFANIDVSSSHWSFSFLTTAGTIPSADSGVNCIGVPYKKVLSPGGTLTIQRNGTALDTYTGEEDKTINISVPTKVSELTNDSSFATTVQLSDEVSTINTALAGKLGKTETAAAATKDSKNQQISTTYIKGISISGKTVTITKGDGTTSTQTTQDTTYSAATQSAQGLMSAADKKKLDGIEAGAQVNTITGVKGNAETTYRTGNVNLTPANIGAAAASHTHDDRYYTETEINTKLSGKVDTSLIGAASGVASLGTDGKVPSSQLPAFVDDVLEYDKKASFPATGESGKIYVDLATNLTYRWSGSAYVEISPSLALGETSSTAYRGDRGKTAYTHSQLTSGNPHNVTKSDVGLGNVENKSSATIRGELTSANVTDALGYTPLQTVTAHTHDPGDIEGGNYSQYAGLDLITRSFVGGAASNKSFGLPAEAIDIEYSTDGGATWSDYGASATAKRNLFSETKASYFFLGKATSKAQNSKNCRLRVTIVPTDRYVSFSAFYCWINDQGSTVYMDLECSTIGNPDTFATVFTGQRVDGWSGHNIRYFPERKFGGSSTQTSNEYKYRMTFYPTAINSSYSAAHVDDIRFFGENVWTAPSAESNPAARDILMQNRMYGWDVSGNVTFPAELTATAFNGKATSAGAADTAETADTATTLTGLTASIAELNYTNGVTSNIQTQLNGKAASSHTHDPGDITAGYLDKRVYHNLGVASFGSILPFVFNDIAYLTARGGSYSFYTTTATDYTANELSGKTVLTTSLDSCFNAQLNYTQLSRAKTDVAVIDLTLPEIFTYDTVFYIDFYIATYRAKKITILARNSNTETTWSQKGENLANSRQYWFVSLRHSSVNASGTTVQGFNQIRIVLTDFNSTDNRIAQIGLINRFSAGIQEVCISRNGSTNIYGGLVPFADDDISLGSSSKKWKNVYATTFNGNATSADTADTATTLTGLTATVAELNYVDGVTSNIQTQLDGKADSDHTHNYAGSDSAGGAATTIATESATSNVARPVFFSYNADTSRVVYNSNFTYNPSTKTLVAANVTGNATSASGVKFDGTVTAMSGKSIAASKICVGGPTGYQTIAANAVAYVDYPVLYNTVAVTSGGSGTAMFLKYKNVKFSTTHAITSGGAKKTLYLVGSAFNGESFTIANPVFTTEVPTSEDSLVYMPIGVMTSATNGYFCPQNVVYAYQNGHFHQVALGDAYLTETDAADTYLAKTAGSDEALSGDLHIHKTSPAIIMQNGVTRYGSVSFNDSNGYLYLSANTYPQAAAGGLIIKNYAGGSTAAERLAAAESMLQLWTQETAGGQITYYNVKIEVAS